MFTCVCTGLCGWSPEIDVRNPYQSSVFFFEVWSHISTVCMYDKVSLWGYAVSLCLLCARITDGFPCSSNIDVDSQDLNSSLLFCATRSWNVQPSPQPSVCEEPSLQHSACVEHSLQHSVCVEHSPQPSFCKEQSPQPSICEEHSPQPLVCEEHPLPPSVCKEHSLPPSVCIFIF